MSDPITPFVFEDELVRVRRDENGRPWFVAKDVCRVLDLTNPSMATNGLEEDELVSVVLISGGQEREMLAVSESGLYALIFRSRKPRARAFRR